MIGFDPKEEIDLTFLLDEEDEDEKEVTDLFEHFSVVADRGQSPLRIDRFLVDRLSGISRNRIQQAAEAGSIFVNDTPVKANYKVKPLDRISLRLERPPYDNTIIPEEIPLDIVYEDEALMVVNKPAGLVVHPGHGNYTGTLLNALAYYLRDDKAYDPNDPRLGLVHRIDKDTSGLLVIAKTPEVKTHLGKQFFYKTTKRSYRAIVWGRMEEESGTVRTNLARDPHDRLIFAPFPYEGDIGKTAVTHWRVIEELGYLSMIECRLETGRTHQIRAHMKSIGHPIFNDERYGGSQILRGNRFGSYKQFVANSFIQCPRQALHAQTLGFVHPMTGEEMTFSCDLPEDMQGLLEKWRVYTSSTNKTV